MSSATYIMQPVITISSTSSGAVKHANSIRKKGRFRVRRVSKTPEGIKENSKRDESSSPVKSVSIATNPICKDVVSLPYISQPINRTRNVGKFNVVIYNVSKLFSKSYDINLASKYILNEEGNSDYTTLLVNTVMSLKKMLENQLLFFFPTTLNIPLIIGDPLISCAVNAKVAMECLRPDIGRIWETCENFARQAYQTDTNFRYSGTNYGFNNSNFESWKAHFSARNQFKRHPTSGKLLNQIILDLIQGSFNDFQTAAMIICAFTPSIKSDRKAR